MPLVSWHASIAQLPPYSACLLSGSPRMFRGVLRVWSKPLKGYRAFSRKLAIARLEFFLLLAVGPGHVTIVANDVVVHRRRGCGGGQP